jgi:hypothetical protein
VTSGEGEAGEASDEVQHPAESEAVDAEPSADPDGSSGPAEAAEDGPDRQPSEGAQPEGAPDQETPSPTVSIEAFEKAWPAMMAEIRQDVGPRRQALLREASPHSVEGGVVIFEVAAHMHFHLEQLKTDTDIAKAIGSAATNHLGSSVKVVFRSADAPLVVAAAEPERAPDKDDLLEASPDAVDPVAVVVDILDGKVIE